jgi:hypothetical protein
VWLSRVPALIPGHIVSFRSSGTVRAEFERQGARDWETFLSLRARELRSGARLVVVLPALADDGITGFERIMDQANAVLAEMVADGALTAEQRARMALGLTPGASPNCWLHSNATSDSSICRWRSSRPPRFRTLHGPITNGTETGKALATKPALFFRSIFMPSLASALDRVRSGDAEALRLFGDRLEAGLRERVASQPAAMHSFAQTIVFAKRT